uniref:Uncharacterized protein n=1 Tax=Ditylenchus dipsaci TaxID=166011 RepID=A0A915E1Q6_9BILA
MTASDDPFYPPALLDLFTETGLLQLHTIGIEEEKDALELVMQKVVPKLNSRCRQLIDQRRLRNSQSQSSMWVRASKPSHKHITNALNDTNQKYQKRFMLWNADDESLYW